MARPGGKSISRAAVLITGLTAVSTLLGFLRDVVIAAVFGAGAQLDAYLIAQGLMNIVLGLVAYAMARSATPVVSREAAAEPDGCRGHTGFDVAFTVTMVVLGVGAVIMGIFAGPVTSVLAPGFDDAQTATAATLTRIVLAATVLVAGTDLLAALAQSHGRFAWASLQGVPFNLIMIAAAGLFGPHFGVTALAVGFVVGSGARLLLQLPPLRSLGTRVRPRLRLQDPGFREIAALVPAMLVGSAIGNINTLVDRAVGSTLEEGAITALSYGWRLVNLPEQLLIASLLVPLYPAISASVKDLPELRRLVNRGLSVTVTILVPLCVVLVVAAGPLVEVAFGRGAFSPEDIADTATAVAWYAPALLAMGCRQVVVSTAYALGDAKAPVIISVIAMVVNVVGDILLAPVMGLAGIALATSASLVLAAVANAWLLKRRHDGVDLAAALPLLIRAALLGTAAGAVGLLLHSVLDASAFVTAVVVAAAVCGIYALGLIALRAPEARVPFDMLQAARRR